MTKIKFILSISLLVLCTFLLISCTQNGNTDETAPEATTTDTTEDTEIMTTSETTEITLETTVEETTTEETTAPESQSECAARLKALLSSAETGKTLRIFGNASADETMLSALQAEIDALEDSGKKISFILADINGNFGVSYNIGMKFTSQSTIKAPYITSVLDLDPSVFEKDIKLIKPLITVSDNDAYEALRDKYGDDPIVRWCKLAEISNRHGKVLYPRSITVRDLAKLWTLMNEYFNTHPEMDEFKSYFTGTAFSAIYQELGGDYTVRTKAGWESGTDSDDDTKTPDPRFTDGDPSNDEIATNDSGIVYAGENPYILVIFSDVQSNPVKLKPLVRAIDDLHKNLSN